MLYTGISHRAAPGPSARLVRRAIHPSKRSLLEFTMSTAVRPVMLAVLPCLLWTAAGSQLIAPPAGAEPKNPPSPTISAGGAPLDPAAYIIGAEDVLNVSVWHEAELTRQVVVRPDGKITMPLVNELNAAGLTPAQLAASITQGLLKFMNAPEVSVSVQQVSSRKYYIQGEVLRPGPYPLVVPTTVMEGLANAGGFKDFANLKKITIIRGSERLKFNYKDVRAGKHLEQNIQLQPGDQISVP